VSAAGKAPVVQVSRKGAVQVIRLADESTRNALTDGLRTELSEALGTAAADARVRAIYLTGSGKSFCSGGDLKGLKAMRTPLDIHNRFRKLGAWVVPLLQIGKPIVVGLNGYAVGGGMGLALTGDVVVAARSARFIPAFFGLGIVPDVSLLYTMPRLVGLARTKRFLLDDEALSAESALEMGLVSQVVDDADLDRTCLGLAERYAQKPPAGIALTKLLLGRTFESSADDMFLYEGLGQSVAMFTAEFQAKLTAFAAGKTTKTRVASAAPPSAKQRRSARRKIED
jgi:2-(1,2-epoxy-1,2-dihydrophenyl)acetyl-CoA isomerase